ncbi:MAG TPA: hypothetical protein VKG65_08685 [Terriglobales bacterium]|nr:hypothetical protein [Terriglobales bacterium]
MNMAVSGLMMKWASELGGNNETAGKRKIGKTRKENRWARRALCEAAWVASKAKNSYLAAQFRRLTATRGTKRAIITVAHTILTGGYHMLKRGTVYQELGANYFDQRHYGCRGGWRDATVDGADLTMLTIRRGVAGSA